MKVDRSLTDETAATAAALAPGPAAAEAAELVAGVRAAETAHPAVLGGKPGGVGVVALEEGLAAHGEVVGHAQGRVPARPRAWN